LIEFLLEMALRKKDMEATTLILWNLDAVDSGTAW